MRVVLQLAYRGSQYKGWQVQPGEITIQSALEEKLRILTGEAVSVVGCGRTDTGVHARNYIAHLDFSEQAAVRFSLKSLNAILPPDIAIQKAYRAPDEFHARFDAVYRKYIYRIHFAKDPFAATNSHQFRERASLPLDLLNAAASLIPGRHDFRSFVKTGTGMETFACLVTESIWIQDADGRLEYHIAANRFVRGMVRLVVGMCLNYALGKVSLEQIQDDFTNQRQIAKSWSVAAEGLTLESVRYPEEKWRQLVLLDSGI
ncbi:MAG TPA: tRNA pseudouridine(38-40) synthase TruA [Saprospiraceae bacterium]|nr:tRNA pseudouridine(38-40) synthase TruA [Saprospiraceae bacterium]